jgi:hypothetical protein
MSGNFREYNWSDILKLIMKDAGLEDEVDQRTRGQVWHVGSFSPPTHEKDTCIRVQVYDKPYSERIQEHAG